MKKETPSSTTKTQSRSSSSSSKTLLSLFQNAPPKKKSTMQKIQNDPIQDPNPNQNDDDLFDQEDSEEDIIAVIFCFLNDLQRRNRIRYRNLYTDEMEIENKNENEKPNPSIDETVEEESNSMELESKSEGKDPAKPPKRKKKTVFGAM